MTGGHEREGFFALVSGHKVKKSTGGGFTRVGALAYPMDGHTDYGSAYHGQIQCAGAIAHAAAIFSGTDVQTQVEAGLDSPVAAIRLEHLPMGADRIWICSTGRYSS